jgi:DNA polymerase-3 subunit beta
MNETMSKGTTAMQFTAEKKDLIRAMKHVCRAVERRATLPILSHARIRVEQSGKTTIEGTGCDQVALQTIDAEVADSGEAIIDAHQLAKVLSKLPKSTTLVTISLDREHHGSVVQSDGMTWTPQTDTLTLDAGKASIAFKSCRYEPADYPQTIQEKTKSPLHGQFSIECDVIADMLDRTKIAMATEEVRRYLCGINLEMLDRNVLRMVATDGHRLVKSERRVADTSGALFGGFSTMSGGARSTIIPANAIKILATMIKEYKGPKNVQCEIYGSVAVFTVGQRKLCTKLIDGTFPDYGRVIPQGTDVMATLNRLDVADIVSRFAAISTKRNAPIKITANGALSLSFENGNMMGTEAVESATFDGEWEVGVNCSYIAEIVSSIKSDRVSISFVEAGKPLLIQGDDEDQDLTVLMPMRV